MIVGVFSGLFCPAPLFKQKMDPVAHHLLVVEECLANPCDAATSNCFDTFDTSSIPVKSFRCTCKTSGFAFSDGLSTKQYTSGQMGGVCTGKFFFSFGTLKLLRK